MNSVLFQRWIAFGLILLGCTVVSAAPIEVLESNENGVRFRIVPVDIQVVPAGEGRVACLLQAEDAFFQQMPRGASLSSVVELALPPDARPRLQEINHYSHGTTWLPPMPGPGDSLALRGIRTGAHLIDSGWIRGQRIQRVRLDLAVHNGENWSRLDSAMYYLDFQVEPSSSGALGTLGALGSSRKGSHSFGVESKAFEDIFAHSLANAEQAASFRQAPKDVGLRVGGMSSALPWFTEDQHLRLMVERDGVYKVTHDFLVEAGLDPAQLDPASLSLWKGNIEQPLLFIGGEDGIFGPNDYFLFIGRHRKGESFPVSFFSPKEAYFLTQGQGTGRRFVMKPAEPSEDPVQRSFFQERHFEMNRHWNSLSGDRRSPYESDHWFWRLYSAVNEPEDHDLTFQLPSVADLGAGETNRVRFCMRGVDHDVGWIPGAEHHVVAYLGGYWAGDIEGTSFDEVTTPWTPLHDSVLVSGANTFTFNLPLDRGLSSDRMYLNWFDLNYRRGMELEEGFLSVPFNELEESNITVSGLSSEDFLVLTDTGFRLMGLELESIASNFEATFSVADLIGESGDLVMVQLDRVLEPQEAVLRPNAELRGSGQQADMLIISPEEFRPILQELQDFHGQTMRVKWIDIEAIYNEFGEGRMHTRAIKDFLTYTMGEWQSPAPSYVFLVGKASRANDIDLTSDPLYPGILPSDWIFTDPYGCTPSDEEFTYLVGVDTLWTDRETGAFILEPDRFQDIMIGRLSVSTPGQLMAWMTKHREYREMQFPGPWMETQVHVGDQGNDFTFEIGNQLVCDYIIPRSHPVGQLHVRGDSPYHGTALDFIDLFNQGTSVLNYNGHGGRGVLSSASIFRATDIRFLSNHGKYPISFAWSCHVGNYDDPDSSSLSELLVRQPGAGSIAFYGSTAKAYITQDNPFMTNYFAAQYSETPYTFGQIIHMAEGSLQGMGGGPNVVQMYNLQGDPALLPALPRQKIYAEESHMIAESGQALNLLLRTEPAGKSGTLTINWHRDMREPVNMSGRVFESWTQAFTDGEVVSLTLPIDMEPREGVLRFAMTTDDGRAIGALPVFMNMPWAGVSGHNPEEARPGESIDLFFDSQLDVDSILVVTNFSAAWPVNPRAESWMTEETAHHWVAHIDSLTSISAGQYYQLNRNWMDGTESQNLAFNEFPSFVMRSLIYRFEVYDGESWEDANLDGRYTFGEIYSDDNENGQWDPPGESFVDSNLSGEYETGEEFDDLNDNGRRDAYIVVPGANIFIHEIEQLQLVDSLMTVTGDSDALRLQARWTLSARDIPDLVERQMHIRTEEAPTWEELHHDSVTVVYGPQDFDEILDLPAGFADYKFTIGPAFLDGNEIFGLGTATLQDSFLLLTPNEGSGGEQVLSAGWDLDLPSNAVSQPVQLNPALLPTSAHSMRQEDALQPGVGLLKSQGDLVHRALELHPRHQTWQENLEDSLAGKIVCTLDPDDQFSFFGGDRLLTEVEIAMGRWVPNRGIWVRQPGGWISDSLQAWMTPRFTADPLLPIAFEDDQGPSIELTVSNQWFAPGDVVPIEPVMQLFLEDENGIDLGEGRFPPQLIFDGDEIDGEDVSITSTGLDAVLQWSPGQLESGSTHLLTILATDALGNQTARSVNFVVSSGEGLRFFANHPNPFGDRTTFAWELGSLPVSLRFELFTASGRKIRVMHVSTPRIGYDELIWDGRDGQGNSVANGVYFVRMLAEGETSVDKIFKLARLQ